MNAEIISRLEASFRSPSPGLNPDWGNETRDTVPIELLIDLQEVLNRYNPGGTVQSPPDRATGKDPEGTN